MSLYACLTCLFVICASYSFEVFTVVLQYNGRWEVFSAYSTATDIASGTLQMKLITANLSSGSSHCIQFGSSLLLSCESQRQTGKPFSKNCRSGKKDSLPDFR